MHGKNLKSVVKRKRFGALTGNKHGLCTVANHPEPKQASVSRNEQIAKHQLTKIFAPPQHTQPIESHFILIAVSCVVLILPTA